MFPFLLEFLTLNQKYFSFNIFIEEMPKICWWIYWKVVCVCCSKGSRILNVTALFSVIALVHKENLSPFFIDAAVFSILNFRYAFFSSLPPNIVHHTHFNINSVSISSYTFSPILMDSLNGGYMKLDLLTFRSQPQLNRMVLFLWSFWEYLFSVKRRKYQKRKVLMVNVV